MTATCEQRRSQQGEGKDQASDTYKWLGSKSTLWLILLARNYIYDDPSFPRFEDQSHTEGVRTQPGRTRFRGNTRRRITVGREITAWGAEKAQQCHKYFLQYGAFASEKTQVRTWGRQTPNLLIVPVSSEISDLRNFW